MGKIHDRIDDRLAGFIGKQKMFFVATAPLSGDGHVNVSPKGLDSFAVIDPLTVAYLDLGGSGIETQAHIQENGRITIMFCAFDGPANILRLYGQGEAVDFTAPEFPGLLKLFPGHDRARAVIRIRLSRIQDSCGYGIPFYEYKGDRDQLTRWASHKSADEYADYAYTKNAQSIDGLPGIKQDKA